MEFKLVAQRKGVNELVFADVEFIDHLRFRLHVGVVAEQRVVDQHAVDVGDGLRGPDWIKHAHVGMQHRAQDLLLRLGRACRGQTHGNRSGYRNRECAKRRTRPQAHGLSSEMGLRQYAWEAAPTQYASRRERREAPAKGVTGGPTPKARHEPRLARPHVLTSPCRVLPSRAAVSSPSTLAARSLRG